MHVRCVYDVCTVCVHDVHTRCTSGVHAVRKCVYTPRWTCLDARSSCYPMVPYAAHRVPSVPDAEVDDEPQQHGVVEVAFVQPARARLVQRRRGERAQWRHHQHLHQG